MAAQCPAQVVQIDRETRRRKWQSEAREQTIVPAAGAHRLARTLGQDLKDHARVVGKRSRFTEVDVNLWADPETLDRLPEPFELGERVGRGRASEHTFGARKHLV